MDHLTLPKDPVREPLEVPYICGGQSYSPPFATYHERMGWSTADILNPRESNRTVQERDVILQAWLFFGLLRIVFGPLFKPAEFVRRNRQSGYIITTERLRPLWQEFAHYSVGMGADDLILHRGNVQKAMKEAHAILNGIIHSQQDNGYQAQQSLVELSIIFLCQFLKYSMHFPEDIFQVYYGTQGILPSIMRQQGWCPARVNQLSREMQIESLYLTSHLKRPDPHISHADCTSGKCVATWIDMNAYVTKHFGHETCYFVAADQRELYDQLKRGSIPLVEYLDDSGAERLRLIPSTGDTKYVAISHVWAHGLGNPNDNSLPQCQLIRLRTLVKRLYPENEAPIPFWIDTISCPTTPDEATDLAIVYMRRTYAEADKVLVLDSYLTDVESATITDLECILRILSSSWMLRLWTLQEGALARNLYFQFADEAINLDETYQRLADTGFESEYSDIGFKLIELRDVFNKGKEHQISDIIYILSRAVRHRSTSVPEDEALCLSTLANLNMDEIATVQPEDRMRKFWSMIPKLSSLILFWTGTRLTTLGYRWAPTTFLGQGEMAFQTTIEDYRLYYEKEDTYLSEDGLVVKAAGIMLNVWIAHIDSGFWVKDESDNWFFVIDCRAGSDGLFGLHPQQDMIGSGAPQLALIPRHSVQGRPFDPRAQQKAGLAVLVLANGECGAVIHARILAMALVVPVEEVPGSTAKLESLKMILDSVKRNAISQAACIEDQSLLHQLGNISLERHPHSHSNRRECDDISHSPNVPSFKMSLDDNDSATWSNRRWSIQLDAQHALFEGITTPQDQEWCID